MEQRDERARHADVPGAEVAAGGGFGRDIDWREIQARAAAHAGEGRRDPRAGAQSVDLVGSELWDFGSVVKYQGESTESEPLDLRRHARVPAEQHALRRARPQPRRRWTCACAAASRSSATRSPRSCSRSSTRSTRRCALDGRKYEVIGVFDEKKSAFGGNFDNYVLIPVTTLRSDLRPARTATASARSVNITVRREDARSSLAGRDRGDARQVLRAERGVQPGRAGQLRLLHQREPDHGVQPDDRGASRSAPSSSASSRWSWPASAS